jgi:hypothetical protein
MPGELVLTKAQQAQALASMSPKERELRAALFADPNSIPVAYSQVHVRVDKDASGKMTPTVVDGGVDYGPNLHLSSLETASTTGSASRYDLTLSLAIVRMSCSGCYQWGINSYANWVGTNPTGMNYKNASEDSIAAAWAGGLYIWSDDHTGYYMPHRSGAAERAANIYRSDASPNTGIGWSFQEWDQYMAVPDALDWANGAVYVRETSWKNTTDNAVSKYYHTYPLFGTSYSLGYPGGASVTISPTNDQWSIAAYASFSH